jgi:hypothetical protein
MQDELTTLIRESSREHIVQCSVGPKGAYLLDTAGNKWAIARLKELRKGKKKQK